MLVWLIEARAQPFSMPLLRLPQVLNGYVYKKRSKSSCKPICLSPTPQFFFKPAKTCVRLHLCKRVVEPCNLYWPVWYAEVDFCPRTTSHLQNSGHLPQDEGSGPLVSPWPVTRLLLVETASAWNTHTTKWLVSMLKILQKTKLRVRQQNPQ